MQAAPGELLPDWPRLMHCFRTPQLTINLPGGVQYCAVPQTVRGCVGWAVCTASGGVCPAVRQLSQQAH